MPAEEAVNATDTTPVIPPELLDELRVLLANPRGGITDPEAARQACERMDRRREENRRLFGEQNVAVELIRQTRDGT